MAIQVYGNVKNGIQMRSREGTDYPWSTRTINGVNLADTIDNPEEDAQVAKGGYTIAAAYLFAQAVFTLIGATTWERQVNVIQTRQINDV